MAASKIEICNLALSHLGMQGITSITESNPSAIACNNFFDKCRDDVFSEYRWPFATVREALVLASDEVLGWTYIYVYPTKASTVWYVFDEGTVDTRHEQEFEVMYIPASDRRVICSEAQYAYAEYTYQVADTTIYSPKFVIALSYRLAASMAHTLTGDASIGLKLMDVYNAILSEAKRIGYSERIKKPSQTSSYQNAR